MNSLDHIKTDQIVLTQLINSHRAKSAEIARLKEKVKELITDELRGGYQKGRWTMPDWHDLPLAERSIDDADWTFGPYGRVIGRTSYKHLRDRILSLNEEKTP